MTRQEYLVLHSRPAPLPPLSFPQLVDLHLSPGQIGVAIDARHFRPWTREADCVYACCEVVLQLGEGPGAVLLKHPDPNRPGQRVRLPLSYRLAVLKWSDNGCHQLSFPENWPHAGNGRWALLKQAYLNATRNPR